MGPRLEMPRAHWPTDKMCFSGGQRTPDIGAAQKLCKNNEQQHKFSITRVDAANTAFSMGVRADAPLIHTGDLRGVTKWPVGFTRRSTAACCAHTGKQHARRDSANTHRGEVWPPSI